MKHFHPVGRSKKLYIFPCTVTFIGVLVRVRKRCSIFLSLADKDALYSSQAGVTPAGTSVWSPSTALYVLVNSLCGIRYSVISNALASPPPPPAGAEVCMVLPAYWPLASVVVVALPCLRPRLPTRSSSGRTILIPPSAVLPPFSH